MLCTRYHRLHLLFQGPKARKTTLLPPHPVFNSSGCSLCPSQARGWEWGPWEEAAAGQPGQLVFPSVRCGCKAQWTACRAKAARVTTHPVPSSTYLEGSDRPGLAPSKTPCLGRLCPSSWGGRRPYCSLGVTGVGRLQEPHRGSSRKSFGFVFKSLLPFRSPTPSGKSLYL